MAIKKPGSRFTDRNKIRKMHKEGYSVSQIANTVSIVEAHVEYVINDWDAAEEKLKNTARQKEKDALDAARLAAQPVPVVTVNDEERTRIREAARLELLAEMDAAKVQMKAEMEASVAEEEVEDETPPEEVEEAEEEKPRPRRRKAVGDKAA